MPSSSSAWSKTSFYSCLGGAFLTGFRRTGQGRGELAALHCIDPPGHYTDPKRYKAVGLLLSFIDGLPKLAGDNTVLRITGSPPEWGDSVVAVFEGVGIHVKGHGQLLELQTPFPPGEALKRTAVVAFALDQFSREVAGRGLLEKARSIAAIVNPRLLGLLDEEWGAYRVRRVLKQIESPVHDEERDTAIAAALTRIETRKLVYFHPGREGLLSHLAKTLNLEDAIGVEPSYVRASRPPAHYRLLHGSLIEPPAGLPGEATALFVDTLPPEEDSRRATAAETLFRSPGFDFVLCIERNRAVKQWAAATAERFGYRVATWEIGNNNAVLFRRIPESAARSDVKSSRPSAVTTRLAGTIPIEPHQWAAPLESLSRLTVDPRFLFYVPVLALTLQNHAPGSELEPLEDVLGYYRDSGLEQVVVQGKPLASRAVMLVCRDGQSKRFGKTLGSIYTRHGKPFFENSERVLLTLSESLTRARLWEQLKTDWVCIECDVLPWGIKAGELIETNGELLRAGEAMYSEAERVLSHLGPAPGVKEATECFRRYQELHERCVSESALPAAFAPVQLIATDGRTYFDHTQVWHMETLSAVCRSVGEPFIETPYTVVDVRQPTAVRSALGWREAVVGSGAEGVVVKPLTFPAKGRRGLVHPTLMSRSREHLRLVYGPEYDRPENRLMLKERAEGREDRSKQRVLRQTALSIEAVERFVRGETLDRVGECVRAALALEVAPQRHVAPKAGQVVNS